MLASELKEEIIAGHKDTELHTLYGDRLDGQKKPL